jgi:hypothetical protein
MSVGEIDLVSAVGTGANAGEAASLDKTSRALVPVASATPNREASAYRRQAPFLAQLLAAKDLHPQTRGRRRAAPREAIAAYQAVASLTNRY